MDLQLDGEMGHTPLSAEEAGENVLALYARILSENPKSKPQIEAALLTCRNGETISGLLDDGRNYAVTRDGGTTTLEVAPRTAQA